MSLLLPTLRADFALCETCHYESAEPLQCPISTFGGTADARISEAELNAWQDHTASRFDVHLFPGDHFYMHKVRPQFLRTLVGTLLQSVGRPTSELAWPLD
jgi:medium-chain acyl-[acyl-carrier-protein] hydrolase